MKSKEPEWYNKIKQQAKYVLEAWNTVDIEPEELVNEMWCRNLRYLKAPEDALPYTRRLRYMMREYLKNRYPSRNLVFTDVFEKVYLDSSFQEIETRDTVLRIFEHLTESEKSLLHLYFYRDYSYRKIGKLHGCSDTAVIHHFKKLMKKLRRYASIYTE